MRRIGLPNKIKTTWVRIPKGLTMELYRLREVCWKKFRKKRKKIVLSFRRKEFQLMQMKLIKKITDPYHSQ